MQIELSGLSPYIVQAIGMVILAVAGMLVAAIYFLARKWGLDVQAAQYGRAQTLATDAVKRVEEIAAAREAAQAAGQPVDLMSPAEKLQTAVDDVMAGAKVSVGDAIKHVLSAVAASPGIGATGHKD